MMNFNSIKRSARVIAIIMAVLFILSSVTQVARADVTSISVTGEVKGTAQQVLQMINKFRTGSDAWAWEKDENGEIYEKVYSNLNSLAYDYNLEQIAIQRAFEIAVKFSHTRPNGQSCFTCKYNGKSSNGENIAIGYGLSDEAAFGLFREDDEAEAYNAPL